MAYVTFTSYGDYWQISSPIPCHSADKRKITITDNVKNTTSVVNKAISQIFFEIRAFKESFFFLTNDQKVAGKIFGSQNPSIVWKVYYSVN